MSKESTRQFTVPFTYCWQPHSLGSCTWMLRQIDHIAFLNDLCSSSSIWNLNTAIQWRKAAHVCSGPEATPSDPQLRESASESNAINKTRWFFRNTQISLDGEATFKLGNCFIIALLRIWLAATCATHAAWAALPSDFEFELHGAVTQATNWHLDISKFPLKHRTASARQSSATV
jgi:hypothetical protein